MDLLLIVCCVACGVSIFSCVILMSEFIFGDLNDDMEFCSNIIEQNDGEWSYVDNTSMDIFNEEYEYKRRVHEAKMEKYQQIQDTINTYRISVGLESL